MLSYSTPVSLKRDIQTNPASKAASDWTPAFPPTSSKCLILCTEETELLQVPSVPFSRIFLAACVTLLFLECPPFPRYPTISMNARLSSF